MKVIEALRNKPDGERLATQLEQVRRVAISKLEHTRDLFPLFTDHTMRHSDGVIAILDWLVPDTTKELLDEWELYFLCAATYLHDIGMVEGCPGTPSGDDWTTYLEEYRLKHEDIESDDLLEHYAKRDYVRDHHHERSEEYIRNNRVELNLRASDIEAEGQIVGRIALGHRKVDLGDATSFSPIAFGNNQLIRRDLLAAYLRLADELDTTAHRTPWAEYQVLDIYDEQSALEWAKHLSLSGVHASQGVITLSGECHDHPVFLRLLQLEGEIKTKLNAMKLMLNRPYATGDEFKLDDPIPYHDIQLDIEHIGYLPIDIKFELQDSEIANLIMGERLYGDKTACIRELLQNAVAEINYIKSRIRQASRVLDLVELQDDQQHASSVRQQLYDLEKQLEGIADIYTPSYCLAVDEEAGEPWVLAEWRRSRTPAWRAILQEGIAGGDAHREACARGMLVVLLDPEYEEPAV